MSDAAMTSAMTYTQVRVREPAGERIFGETPTIGGVGADVVVPGIGPGGAIQIERRKGVWVAQPVGAARVRFDGRLLAAVRDLRRHDVIAVGDAQVVVTDVSRTLLRLEVCHLVGNATVSPSDAVLSMSGGDGDEELVIQAAGVALAPESYSAAPSAAPAVAVKQPRPPRSPGFWAVAASAAVALLVALLVVSQLNAIALDVDPGDARVSLPGTLLPIHMGQRLWLFSGNHIVRAEHAGYLPAQTNVNVSRGTSAIVHLRLAKLPGTLLIDTAGVAATVSIDGVESGNAPGATLVPAGNHTITLRAPRYVDYITTIAIDGAGVRQALRAALQPSWGTLQIIAMPVGAHVSVDGADNGAAPSVVDAPSGVRQVRISAPKLKTWESSVVLKAGEALTVGPITLGQPDAHLTLHSIPSDAEVTVAGTLRGRTPIEVDLPAGIQYDLMVNSPGYAPWTRQIFAAAGKAIAVDARLETVGARVTVQGEPDGAEVFIDGTDQGPAPQSLQLSAIDHRVEARKKGWITFVETITPAQGFDRIIQYRLKSEDHATDLASTLYTQTGYMLRLVPVGAFSMGSDRREQGRRPNEGFRQVILKRPFYLGVTEVTNEQFRRFHPNHESGVIERRSLDLDEQPVSQVSWNDAAEYCNWQSEHDYLPPAYEKTNDTYVLRKPVTTGYRLPTEAEWEYAARYAAPGRFTRFAWGDALPVAADVGNLAGAETGNSLSASLPGYRDDYPVVAPVGRFKATPLGLHDMSGNVSEWVNDYYLSFVDPAPVTDPLGPDDGSRHVIRGANWKSAAASDLRLAWRDGAADSGNTLGFRMARYAE